MWSSSLLVAGYWSLAVGRSFARKPTITFDLDAIAIPITSIPNLSDFIFNLVESSLAQYFVWPRKVIIPLYYPPYGMTEEERSVLSDRSGVAVLRVRIVGAQLTPVVHRLRPNVFSLLHLPVLFCGVVSLPRCILP